MNEITKKLKYCKISIPKFEEVYGYKTAGRPSKDAPKELICCKVHTVAKIDKDVLQQAIEKELLYVLAVFNSNLDAAEVYKHYHMQNDIEGIWRSIKCKELYAPNLYLQNMKRIQALLALIAIAVFIERTVVNYIKKLLIEHQQYLTKTSGNKTQTPNYVSISKIMDEISVHYANRAISIFISPKNKEAYKLLDLIDDDIKIFYKAKTYADFFYRCFLNSQKEELINPNEKYKDHNFYYPN